MPVRLFCAALSITSAVILSVLAPAPTAQAADPTCAVIGDSITYMAGTGKSLTVSALTASGKCGGGISFYAVIGKRIASADSAGLTTMQNVANARRQLGHVDNWIIALGTNNTGQTEAAFTADVAKVMTAIGPADHVDWINLGFYDEFDARTAKVNPWLFAALSAYPNASNEFWNYYVHHDALTACPGNLWRHDYGDDIHLSPKYGFPCRATYYADVLG